MDERHRFPYVASETFAPPSYSRVMSEVAAQVSSPVQPILIIGPDPSRFQGGIALFSKDLFLSLSAKTSCEFWTWNRPYPAFRRELLKGDRRRPELDIFSFLSWIQVARAIRERNPRALVFNWVHPLQAFTFLTLRRMLPTLPMYVICHNLLPHEPFPFSRGLTRLALKNAQGVIVHGQTTAARAERLYPELSLIPLFLPPLNSSKDERGDSHPDFDAPKSTELDAEEFQRLPAKKVGRASSKNIRLIVFGHIRPYKGIELLLDALPKFLELHPNTLVQIVGKPLNGLRIPFATPRYLEALAERIRQLKLEKVVTLRPEYITDGELRKLLERSTLAIFPFQSPTPSASVMTALQAGVPVLASDFPEFQEIVREKENGFLFRAGSCSDLTQMLSRSVEFPFEKVRVKDSIQHLSWDNYAGELLDAMSQAQ